jgi:O-antigen ligase
VTVHPGAPLDRVAAFGAAGIGVGAAAIGFFVASGNVGPAVVLGSLPLIVVTSLKGGPAVAALLELGNRRAVGVAWVLLVVSTFVWRDRSTSSLVSNPLDSAALLRVALVAAAALLLFAVLLRAPLGPGLPLAVKFLLAYVGVGFVAAAASPLPLFAGYRVAELLVGVAAVVAVATTRVDGWTKPLNLVLVCLGAIVAVAWVEAVVLPSRAWEPRFGFGGYVLTGAVPSFSSNTLGEYGAILAVWSIAQLGSAYPRPVLWTAAFGGIVTVVATQYRTGAVAFIAALAYILWQRRKPAFAFAVVAGALLVLASGQWNALRDRTEFVFARGNPGAVGTLDSRTIFWRAAEPYIRDRPVIGWGLNVEARAVLTSIGRGRTSTIHGTWIEALLGTGIAGTMLLAFAFLALLAAALSNERGAHRTALVAIWIVLAVRSITGGTIELFNLESLLFGALALAASCRSSVVARRLAVSSGPRDVWPDTPIRKA